ncbi:MAG: hypothetical protein K6G26_07980 [Lachnospiraceae bacterium]|nr:hypothetical protein [Lachnospiraceae bacterium]
MKNDEIEFQWIAKEIDVSHLMYKMPAYIKEMIDEIEKADLEGNVAVYAQVCDDLEIYTKLLVPEVLTMHEWHMFCEKYSFPPE